MQRTITVEAIETTKWHIFDNIGYKCECYSEERAIQLRDIWNKQQSDNPHKVFKIVSVICPEMFSRTEI